MRRAAAPFDPNYMKALFDAGFAQGKSAAAFATAPPPYPGPPATDPKYATETTLHNRERPHEESWEELFRQ